MSPDPAVHRALSAQCRVAGDDLGSLAHLIAAQTLEARTATPAPPAPTELLNVATGYFMKGDHDTALDWYGLVLQLDPTLAAAHQNMAAIHADRGDQAQARACRERAYRLQRVFVEPVVGAHRRLLILCAGQTSGNVPFETLLSTGATTRIKYAIDFAAEEEDGQLPPFDLVFNAIGEPDVAVQLAARLDRFTARCARPLLNRPGAAERTQRQRLAELLKGVDGVVTAHCSRQAHRPANRAELIDRLAASGIALPVLLRPVESHGGVGLVRCDSLDALKRELDSIGGAHYLTAFHDYRSADGHYRKYRIVFVDGEPFAYHLAISTHWMVHYFSADMLDHAWKTEEERRFLDDPASAIGPAAMNAVANIGRCLDLDYAGIDFSLLPDGRVLVFEANATMLVHRERNDGPLARRNLAVQHIADAFERMLARHTSPTSNG